VFPLLAGEGYVTHLVILMLISSILATSLNMLMGFSGLVSMAHAAFFGIGGYASGILTARHGLSFWLALPLAVLVTAVIALGIGLPSFRTRGIYYIIVTIAFQLIASEVFDNWSSMTGGGLGLKGIPRPTGAIFSTRLGYYYLTLAMALGIHLLIVRVLRSPLGRALSAIRDNETKALMMGVSPLRYKLFAFVFASAMAGAAGSLYVHYLDTYAIWVPEGDYQVVVLKVRQPQEFTLPVASSWRARVRAAVDGIRRTAGVLRAPGSRRGG